MVSRHASWIVAVNQSNPWRGILSVMGIYRQLWRGRSPARQIVSVSAEPNGHSPLRQIDDEQDGKHVRCESGVEHKLPDYLTLYVVTHDELCDVLESHEQNESEQIKLCKDCGA